MCCWAMTSEHDLCERYKKDDAYGIFFIIIFLLINVGKKTIFCNKFIYDIIPMHIYKYLNILFTGSHNKQLNTNGSSISLQRESDTPFSEKSHSLFPYKQSPTPFFPPAAKTPWTMGSNSLSEPSGNHGVNPGVALMFSRFWSLLSLLMIFRRL